jgi:hypothetical protein
MYQDIKQPLSFAARPDRIARRVADRTANPRFSRTAHQVWLVAYRNAFDAVADEAPVVSRRGAIVIAIATFSLGLLLRGVL